MAVLRQYNPWWSGMRVPDLPVWRRAAFPRGGLLAAHAAGPPGRIAERGAPGGEDHVAAASGRGCSLQGVPPQNILYATFDHPLLKLAGLDGMLKLWREFEPAAEGPEYLFLDEIQFTRDWQTWLKHQVDFDKRRRIAVTGSATPLVEEGQESGVGRWHTIKLATLSFFEYMQIKQLPVPSAAGGGVAGGALRLDPGPVRPGGRGGASAGGAFPRVPAAGGFPQCALVPNVDLAQKLLREDIVDKVLKRDMTALFGVRRVLELEQTFLYLCLHDGGLLDMVDLSKNLEVKKPTAQNYITLLESTHLIYRLPPHGYGKEILRARYKVYLADAAIAPSVLLKGKAMIEDAAALSRASRRPFSSMSLPGTTA